MRLNGVRHGYDEVAFARALTRPPCRLDAETALSRLRDRGAESTLTWLKGWAPAETFAGLVEELTVDAKSLDVRDLFFELMNRTRYLDTLAEVYFARGDAASAAAQIRRCIELEPQVKRHRKQLARFEAGAAPATQPE